MNETAGQKAWQALGRSDYDAMFRIYILFHAQITLTFQKLYVNGEPILVIVWYAFPLD